MVCGNETGVLNAEGGNMYTKAKHDLSSIFKTVRVAQSDSRSNRDQEDQVRSSGPAHLSVEKIYSYR